MKRIALAFLLLIFLLPALTLFAQTVPDAKNLFPSAEEFDGWKRTDEILVYPADDMWKHINGAADIYIRYACSSLTVSYYQRSSDEMEIATEIYTMKDRLHAYGIFTAQKPADSTILGIGAQGYIEGNTLNFYKGPYYIKAQINPQSPKSPEELKSFAHIVAGKIKADISLPRQLAAFPSEDIVKDSFQFIPQGALGMKVLVHAFMARYKRADEEITLLLSQHNSKDNSLKNLDEFTQSISKRCQAPPEKLKLANLSGMKGIERYKGPFWAVTSGNNLIVVVGTENKEWVEKSITTLINNLDKK